MLSRCSKCKAQINVSLAKRIKGIGLDYKKNELFLERWREQKVCAKCRRSIWDRFWRRK